ncbi:MAG TPA: tetratricopeptide repeat protein [Streptosporangiaceae bacterium]|nr:tetratricopeptide repeat protein [Streptosporangiaceae bacterium]
MQQSPDFSLRGAIDLGARQAAAQRRQQAARASASGSGDEAGSAFVIDVTDQSFNADVVDRSRSVPVILDLWADWCGPCKQLSPVLEKLADEAAGAWVLAKVDVDANPQLSAALQVQSIPMVVAVVAGQVVDGFLGALPEANVREWLGQIMQVAGQLGLAGPSGTAPTGTSAGAGAGDEGGAQAAGQAPGAPGQAAGRPGAGPGMMPGGPGGPGDPLADPAFAEAQQAMERGDLDSAAAAFERVLASAPGHPIATLGLAQVDLIRRVNSYDQAKVRRDADDNPADPEAQSRAADIDVAQGRIEAGFDRLLDTVRRTSGEERNQARLHLLGLFEAFPPRDPRITKARATLSSLLF